MEPKPAYQIAPPRCNKSCGKVGGTETNGRRGGQRHRLGRMRVNRGMISEPQRGVPYRAYGETQPVCPPFGKSGHREGGT